MLILAITLLILVGTGLLVAWRINRRRERIPVDTATQELKTLSAELRGRIDALVGEKDSRAKDLDREREAYKSLTTQWDVRVSAINSSLETISKHAADKVEDMANQLKPIISIFRSPQTAGIEFGEAELEMLLKTRLGESLYVRKPRLLAVGQEVVDFAITLPECIIPIDSKFPSATYKAWAEAATETEARPAWRAFRDAMLNQLDATAKYIKPDAGTTDYALLFVPSDIIYQQAFLSSRLYDQENPIPKRAQELQVFGCSTQTLMPYFGLIRLGLRNLKIADDVKGIRQQIEQLDVLFRSFDGDWKVLRGHIDRLAKHVESVSGDRGTKTRLEKAVRRLASPGTSEEEHAASPPPETIDAPELFATETERSTV